MRFQHTGNRRNAEQYFFHGSDAANAPTLFPNGGEDTNEVTLPPVLQHPQQHQFAVRLPQRRCRRRLGQWQRVLRYLQPLDQTWSHNFVINGELTSVNAYLNSLVYDSSGNLDMSWTWRATANWQTNSNIMFAQSPDNGTTWFKQAARRSTCCRLSRAVRRPLRSGRC